MTGQSQYFHATAPWEGMHPPNEDGYPRHDELSDLDLACFTCPLPECDESDPRCARYEQTHVARRVIETAYKARNKEDSGG